MRTKNINLDKILKYVMVLSILYFSQTGVITYGKYPQFANYIMILSFFLIMIVFVLKVIYFKLGIPAWAVWWGIGCIFLYMITMAVTGDYRPGYILLAMNIFLGIAFCSMYSRTEFYNIFVNCIVGISIFGMISTYILVPFLKDIIPIVGNEAAQYYDLFLSYPLIHVEKYRLNAIWTEPGMLAVYLSFALIFDLFFIKGRMWKKAVLILAMLFTMSSAGYIFLLLILSVYFVREITNIKDTKIIIVFICIIAMGGFVLYLVFTNEVNAIFSKYNWYSLNFIGRFAPMVYNLDRGIRSPLWGWGFEEGMFYVRYSFYTGSLFCNTSTTTQLFHYFGIIIPIFTVIASYLLTGMRKEKWYIRVALTFILILSVNFESLVLDQVYTIILFSIFMKMEGDRYEGSLDKFNSNQAGVSGASPSVGL